MKFTRQSLNTMLLAISFIGLGVLFGAMGAHLFKNILSIKGMGTFNTGLRYQVIHGLALLFLSLLQKEYYRDHYFNKIAYLFSFGILFFSGNCYLLAFTQVSLFAHFVPIGGLMFLLGWILLFLKIRSLKFEGFH